MRRLSIAATVAVVSTIALTQIASAADLPPLHKATVYKAPPPPPTAVYSWTGFYVGGNLGYSWGDAHTDLAGRASTVTFPPGSLAQDGFPDFPGFLNAVDFADSNAARLSGVIGGGQIGYNHQFSPTWVLGFETDIQGSSERGSSTLATKFSGFACTEVDLPPPTCGVFRGQGALQGTLATGYEANIDWFGTVRGRLGYLVNEQTLLYGTGGLAYGEVKLSGSTIVHAALTDIFNGAFPFPPGATAFSESEINVGWTAGAGVEGRFSYWLPTGWTWKLEYLYVDLGSVSTAASFVTGPPSGLFGQLGFGSPLTGTITTHTHFTDNIVRVGLNYQFH
jgi:outer membrane immunogenic protein